jgi:hypothetical protein
MVSSGPGDNVERVGNFLLFLGVAMVGTTALAMFCWFIKTVFGLFGL